MYISEISELRYLSQYVRYRFQVKISDIDLSDVDPSDIDLRYRSLGYRSLRYRSQISISRISISQISIPQILISQISISQISISQRSISQIQSLARCISEYSDLRSISEYSDIHLRSRYHHTFSRQTSTVHVHSFLAISKPLPRYPKYNSREYTRNVHSSSDLSLSIYLV